MYCQNLLKLHPGLFSTSCKNENPGCWFKLQKLSKREKIKMGVYSLCREVFREAVIGYTVTYSDDC